MSDCLHPIYGYPYLDAEGSKLTSTMSNQEMALLTRLNEGRLERQERSIV